MMIWCTYFHVIVLIEETLVIDAVILDTIGDSSHLFALPDPCHAYLHVVEETHREAVHLEAAALLGIFRGQLNSLGTIISNSFPSLRLPQDLVSFLVEVREVQL